MQRARVACEGLLGTEECAASDAQAKACLVGAEGLQSQLVLILIVIVMGSSRAGRAAALLLARKHRLRRRRATESQRGVHLAAQLARRRCHCTVGDERGRARVDVIPFVAKALDARIGFTKLEERCLNRTHARAAQQPQSVKVDGSLLASPWRGRLSICLCIAQLDREQIPEKFLALWCVPLELGFQIFALESIVGFAQQPLAPLRRDEGRHRRVLCGAALQRF